ncbi:Zn(II)2Cys6 transcription factor [Aspergillus clavatus NRRL 1]|uniref:C6 finger domain protein, putative n=1 Tax=Aspergillus clavatus (strain ATCC 1007 / CBS 513.65 / DSM 816 / NCTC 3887 / NRRL 1 / QM 1276 / 107) TaxID=344612 RepID=A1C6D0_ASPCL|nr:C6 finger domain protein, putative [Aspergillus clavatus NRRL 1]EAW13951.1 C6 finger domain protein, putative [Aspergillus clavatus NRRL 1]
MAHSFDPAQAPLTGYLSATMPVQEPTQIPAYSVFGAGQYPDSVAFWHNAPPQLVIPPAPPYPRAPPKQPQQPSLLQPISDQKKHKRTRSGCFTCRSRRIKCDETRPICERCRKGNRDCVYPSPTATGTSSKAGTRSGSKPRAHRPPSQGSDSSSHLELDDIHTLEPIVDEGEAEDGSVGSGPLLSPSSSSVPPGTKPGVAKKRSVQSLWRRRTKQPAGEPSLPHADGSSSPSTEASSRFESMSARSASVGLFGSESLGPPGASHLPDDIRFYLAFHQDHMSYRHYFLKSTFDRFFRQSIIQAALQYEPLLYAVVGFAAYHHSVQTSTGKLYIFLQYYDKALKLLRKSLASGEPHCEPMLITVLALTTFEEFIGDWVNLIDHHQAAHALVRELLTPESIKTNELHSDLFCWHARFDIVAGLLAGNETVLSREWYMAKEEYDAQQAALFPEDPQKQIALASSINRRFGLEMASLYAKLSRGLIPIEDFTVQNEQLAELLERMKLILELFNDSEYVVTNFPNKEPLTDDDIVDLYVPGSLHTGPLWEINFAWLDYLAAKAMFKYQSLLAIQQSSMAELESLAMEQCRRIETIARWPEKESGYMFAFKNSVGMASMFLPRDNRHVMWAREKFAKMEQNGYITPPKFRAGLAVLWHLPEINHWWLPDDSGYPEIIREVRAMTEERTVHARDDFRENVRNMRTMFWKLNFDDTESETSLASIGPDAP